MKAASAVTWVTRLPGLDLGLTSKVQADRGGRPMFTIGKLAGIAGVSSDTLRYYEREGLIAPAGKIQRSK